MRADEAARSQTRGAFAFLLILAMLATLPGCPRASADELPASGETAAEIAAQAGASASELAASLRLLDNSLRSAPALAAQERALTADAHDALVEAGMKAQLAGLARELDLLSATLASGTDPEKERILLESLTRRAAALSQIGARPSRVPIPPELQTELRALWSDVTALSAARAGASTPIADLPFEASP